MDVIVVEDSVADAVLLERQIAALGHTVRGARSGGKAVELLKERLPNVLVTDGTLPELTGESLTRLVRSQDSVRYVYVIYVTASKGPEALKSAFAAGADDFMEKPISKDELVARLRAADRIVQLETRLRAKVRELESALRRLEAAATMAGGTTVAKVSMLAPPNPTSTDDEFLVPRDLAEKGAWKRMEPTVRTALGDFLQRSFDAAPVPNDFRPTIAKSITLTSVALVMELRVTLEIEPASANAIAEGLFGPEPDEALVDDTLAEVANLVMGGIKSSFAEDGVTLTSGLPVGVVPNARLDNPLFLRERLFACPDGTRVALALQLARCPTKRVRSFELSEGMIFAANVVNGAGMLLVPAGVRLSTATIDRVSKSLPDQAFEVIAPQ